MHPNEKRILEEQIFKIHNYMTKQEAERLISDWNGKDHYFTSGGDIYTEYDVQEAYEIIERHESKV